MAKVVKKWIVDNIYSETVDGRNIPPNIFRNSGEFDSLDGARHNLQMQLGRIIYDDSNKIEWIVWETNLVEIRFNYKDNNNGETIRRTVTLEIIYANENGKICNAEIGY